MKVGIMQSYFFPYIGYFQLIDAVDKFILYEHVTFRKKSWIIRNRILDKGKFNPIYINVPVKKQSSFKNIGEIEIDNSVEWRKKVINLLLFNYKKSPYFKEVYPFITRVINFDCKYLHEYNSKVIIELCKILAINTQIVYSNETLSIEKKISQLNTKNYELKSERIIELMYYLKGNKYINPIGGKELYNKRYFTNRGIDLSFIESYKTDYSQFKEDHIPYLSIIDVLFHNGFEGTKKLLQKYKVV